MIRLNFLEVFSIEEEETCKYDYLEIRDGQFGYSSLIQKICGNIPPSYIESSGRFLWLRFASDNDIHYVGFKVGVEFVLAGHLMGGKFFCEFIFGKCFEFCLKYRRRAMWGNLHWDKCGRDKFGFDFEGFDRSFD